MALVLPTSREAVDPGQLSTNHARRSQGDSHRKRSDLGVTQTF